MQFRLKTEGLVPAAMWTELEDACSATEPDTEDRAVYTDLQWANSRGGGAGEGLVDGKRVAVQEDEVLESVTELCTCRW